MAGIDGGGSSASNAPAPVTLTYTLDNLSKVNPIGRGAKSVVWLVKHEPTDRYFALKEISREHIKTQEEAQHVWNERSVLTELSGGSGEGTGADAGGSPFPGCCRLYSAMKDDRAVYLLLEFIAGAPLHKHFQACKGFTLERTKFYIASLVEILAALHSQSIIYRDLKASNVMIDAHTGRPRLVDFGFAKKLIPNDGCGGGCGGDPAATPTTRRRTASVCGTFFAMAPEVYQQDKIPPAERIGYDFSVDWWGIGVLTYECLEATAPFGYRSTREATLQELAAKSPSCLAFSGKFDDSARDFVTSLLQADPKIRLGSSGGADEVKAHPFFEGFDWMSVAVDRAALPADGSVNKALDLKATAPDFDETLGEFASFESCDLHAEAESLDTSDED